MSIEFTGERVVPGLVDADLWNEHVARYHYASAFCAGARVLDAGTGAGYGCASLAANAAFAAGFDIAHDAVRHAADTYSQPNTGWLQASLTSFPFAPSVFDVVVAFEVIEHLEDWKSLLREARRVLVPGGVFLVSTPNKSFYAESRQQSGPNPYHAHEFELEEYRSALAEFFPHVSIILQNHSACVMFESTESRSVKAHVEQAGSPEQSNFFLAVCSDAPTAAPSLVYVPRAANVLKERAEHIRRLEQELATKNQWLNKSQAEHAELVALHDQQTAELKASNVWAAELDQKLTASLKRIVAVQTELEDTSRAWQESHRELEARTKWAHDLESELAEVRRHLADSIKLLDQAEATVVERTEWARDLQGQLDKAEALLNSVKASRWIKLGRTMHVGPELPS